MPSDKDRTAYRRCSFCGKTQDEVKKMVAGPAVFICNECISLCNQILKDEDKDEPKGPSPVADVTKLVVPKPAEIKERLSGSKAALETFADFAANLEANKIDINSDLASVGPWLDFDPVTEKFTGEFAEEANKIVQEEYASGFELPVIS